MRVLNSMPPYNLFGLDAEDYDKAKVVAIPVPYDSTVSFKTGAREGPRAIIEASRAVELYSEELGRDVSKIGIFTTDEIEPHMNSPEEMVRRIEREVGIVLDDGKMPLLLGGEHTIALGPIYALTSRKRKFSVLHFDAHSDSRDEYMGTRYSHACVMARAREKCSSCLSVGIRSVPQEGAEAHSDEMLFMKDIRGMTPKQTVKKILSKIKGDVYITVDLDVLDPAEMPSTGTPEPGGMSYAFLKEVLRGVAKERKVLGMDFCELSPIPFLTAPNFLAAKLIYLTLGAIF